jgi:acyl-coenzyme A thioesterase 13
VLEREQPPAAVDHHADSVEAKLRCPWPPPAGVGEPGPRQAPDPDPLARRQPLEGDRLPAPAAAAAGGLDLDEHEHPPVVGDQVDLALPRADVALQDLEAEPLEVGGGEVLSERSEPATGVHRPEATGSLGHLTITGVERPEGSVDGACRAFLIASCAMTTPPSADRDATVPTDREPAAPPGPEGGPRSLDGLTSFIGLRWEDPETVRVTIRPELINRGGLLSGVVTFALVDYCMGSTLWAQTSEQERIATISISINYIQTAMEGDVICHSTLNRRNRSIGVMQSEVRHEDGRLLATAIGSYSIFPPKARLDEAALRARAARSGTPGGDPGSQ